MSCNTDNDTPTTLQKLFRCFLDTCFVEACAILDSLLLIGAVRLSHHLFGFGDSINTSDTEGFIGFVQTGIMTIITSDFSDLCTCVLKVADETFFLIMCILYLGMSYNDAGIER